MFKNDFDYRGDYFKKHKGILNSGVYLCSYCGKPIVKKGSHVDHIVAKSKNNFILNRSFNTTIACAKCNLKKSDKVDYRIIQGYASKATGGVFGLITAPIFAIIGIGITVLKGTFRGLSGLIGWSFKKVFQLIWTIISGVLGGVLSLIFGNILVAGIILAGLYIVVTNN